MIMEPGLTTSVLNGANAPRSKRVSESADGCILVDGVAVEQYSQPESQPVIRGQAEVNRIANVNDPRHAPLATQPHANRGQRSK
jgi:hypothetical protein